MSVRALRRGSIAASRAAAAGPFAPEGIAGVAEVWVADDLALSDGGAVSSWVGRVAARDLAQASSGKRPTYDLDGVGGEPSVNFDGSDDLLAYAGTLSTATSGHVFVVGQQNAATEMACWSTSDLDTGQHHIWAPYDSAGMGILCTEGASTDYVTASVTASANTPALIEWASDGSDYALRENNTVKSLTVAAGSNSGNWFGDVTLRDVFTLGAFNFVVETRRWNGRIAAVIVVDGAISGGDRTSLDGWVADKYGITLA